MLIDTHAHLFWESFQHDFDEVINRALGAGVSTIINVGVDFETSEKALRHKQGLADIPNLSVYSSIGIHPHESEKYFSNTSVSIQNDIEKLEELYIKSPSTNHSGSTIVAVGECGLDYAFEGSLDYIPFQKKLFQAQIELSRKLCLP